MKKHLNFYEWFILSLFCTGIFLFSVCSHYAGRHSVLLIQKKSYHQKNISVLVLGAVRFPGTHHIKEGALIREALIQAQPLPMAALSKIKKSKALKPQEVLLIPSKKRSKKRVESSLNKQI
ncbi:MAG: hypothetical protein JHC93_00285 [Parachlamydiales bacterium]|nr:hypothetical protein [Parachlamydiales bacterium]